VVDKAGGGALGRCGWCEVAAGMPPPHRVVV
jgi:hypothetical protein